MPYNFSFLISTVPIVLWIKNRRGLPHHYRKERGSIEIISCLAPTSGVFRDNREYCALPLVTRYNPVISGGRKTSAELPCWPTLRRRLTLFHLLYDFIHSMNRSLGIGSSIHDVSGSGRRRASFTGSHPRRSSIEPTEPFLVIHEKERVFSHAWAT